MERLRVAVVLFDGVEELDFAGPYEVFSNTQQADVCTVAADSQVVCRGRLKVTADWTFAAAPPPDVVVVPGGPAARERPDLCAPAERWLRQAVPAARLTLSVCTGAFLLARAGLLDGLDVTTHHKRRELLAERHPQLRVRGARVLDAGRLISTAGVTAGLDGSLHAVSRLFGPALARFVARQIEYPWRPQVVAVAGGQEQAEEDASGDWARALSRQIRSPL